MVTCSVIRKSLGGGPSPSKAEAPWFQSGGTCFFLLPLGLEQAEAPARPGLGSFFPTAGSTPLAARPSPHRSAALTSHSTPRLTASLGPRHTLPEQVETRREGDPQGGSRRVPKPGPGSPQQTPGRVQRGPDSPCSWQELSPTAQTQLPPPPEPCLSPPSQPH